jgi:hypothetical protein
MAASKSSNSSGPASPRITCYGTAFLADDPIDLAVLNRGIAPELPQFSSPRLDASFLINCGRFLAGRIHAGRFLTGKATTKAPSSYVKRVAGTDFRLANATHFYQCSAEPCDLLAGLTAERAAEIALKWYDMIVPTKTKPAETNGRSQRRLAILKNLAALAKQGTDRRSILMLRVEYRKQG